MIFMQRDGGVNQAVLNSYCWMYSTFDIPPNFKGKYQPELTNLIDWRMKFI